MGCWNFNAVAKQKSHLKSSLALVRQLTCNQGYPLMATQERAQSINQQKENQTKFLKDLIIYNTANAFRWQTHYLFVKDKYKDISLYLCICFSALLKGSMFCP